MKDRRGFRGKCLRDDMVVPPCKSTSLIIEVREGLAVWGSGCWDFWGLRGLEFGVLDCQAGTRVDLVIIVARAGYFVNGGYGLGVRLVRLGLAEVVNVDGFRFWFCWR